MPFALPLLPQSGKRKPRLNEQNKDITTFDYDAVSSLALIGEGAYGKVFKGFYHGKSIVLKVLADVTDEQISQEAKFLSKLNHPNVVEFRGMYLPEKALMMEFMEFDLKEFGVRKAVNSLDCLIREFDKTGCKGFEHIITVAARGSLSGLSYLHSQGVAHRDLKPSNILISNIAFTSVMKGIKDDDEKRRIWLENPCEIKLTDFGESWGRIVQSSSVVRSKTVNVYKGTPVFMAPEVLDPGKRPEAMGIEAMKKVDTWSLGMVFYCLSNVVTTPYFEEVLNENVKLHEWTNFIRKKISTGILPENSTKYLHLLATEWADVYNAFKVCVKVDPNERPSLDEVGAILQYEPLSEAYALKNHQGSALEAAQATTLDGGQFIVPENDGTNCCCFLALKICEQWLLTRDEDKTNWSHLCKQIEDIIDNFPVVVNKVRDKQQHYEVVDCYRMLDSNGFIKPLKLNQVTTGFKVYSEKGKNELYSALKKLNGIMIMLCPPYSFVIGSYKDCIFVADTHVIGKELGGDDKGIVIVFPNINSCSRWIWKRLFGSGVVDSSQQLVEVTLQTTPEPEPSTSSKSSYSLSSDNSLILVCSDENSEKEHVRNRNSDFVQCYEKIREDDNEAIPSNHQMDRESRSNSNGSTVKPDRNSARARKIDMECQTGNDFVEIITGDNSEKERLTDNSIELINLDPKVPTTERNLIKSWDDAEYQHWGKDKLPYLSTLNKKLGNSEALALISSKFPICRRIPQACRRNAIFVIDNKSLKDPEDVKSDLNGVFGKCHEVKWKTVCSKTEDFAIVQVVSNKKEILKLGQLHMRVHRTENNYGLVRNIIYFLDKTGCPLKDKIVLQYYINKKINGNSEEVSFKVASHGNAKSLKPFYVVKKSSLRQFQDEIGARGKRSISLVYDDAHKNQSGESDYGDLPRSKKQLIDIARPKLPDNEVGDILAYNEELGDDEVVWFHGDIPSDLWVFGTKVMEKEMNSSAECYPLSVDATFNFGAFEVTPFTYRNVKIESKSKNIPGHWVPTVMVGPTIIQHNKDPETYELSMRAIARHCDLKNKENMYVIIDGEQALISACKSSFNKCSMLRCTKHFKSNCEDCLKKIGIPPASAGPMLDVVFGDNGLIEAEDKEDLKKKMKTARKVLDDIERSVLQLSEGSKTEFSAYLAEREKSVLRKLIRKPRREAMRIDGDKVPPRAYTNQSEMVNSLLSAKKVALRFTKKDDVSKSFFIKDIWLAVVKHQDCEIEKALIGQSNEYRLSQEAKYLKVDIETWFGWSENEQKRYLKDFRMLSKSDLLKRKEISTEGFGDPKKVTPAVEILSVKLSERLPNLLHASLVESKALYLLNSPDAIVLSPSLNVHDKGKTYIVASMKGGLAPNMVKVSVQQTISCRCKGFRFSCVCAHSVAIAEKENILSKFVSSIKSSRSRSSVTYPMELGGAGRKGQQRRRKRQYDSSNVSSSDQSTESQGRPFTEIWHNNNPLVVCSINEITEEKNHCGYCAHEFPRGRLAIVPFNIAIKHQERWKYLNQKHKANPSEPMYLPSSAKKLTTRYYCIKKNCIYKRFPYFCPDLLEVDSSLMLTVSHKKLIKEQLDVTL